MRWEQTGLGYVVALCDSMWQLDLPSAVLVTAF